ncbi:Translocon-associated protein subunit beta [Geodia barretti]|jgi:hypothetical protein|uniref:Translocon-associated protein subunit beta n=1 Tax=Geodia barretti TaxID=519541 RepID=A0AA35WFH3_GEOBA|nr:Translocon-associated protein subunit beta [Geodia barretti]
MLKVLAFCLVVGLCLPLGHGGANLIASKTILNEHMVEGKDLTIKYSIYNVGTSAAVNVLLEDSSFPEEHFVIEQGLLTTTWDRIQSYPHFLSLSLPPISMSYLPVCLSTCCVHVAGDVHKFSRV